MNTSQYTFGKILDFLANSQYSSTYSTLNKRHELFEFNDREFPHRKLHEIEIGLLSDYCKHVKLFNFFTFVSMYAGGNCTLVLQSKLASSEILGT